jgi:hypothetical protein
MSIDSKRLRFYKKYEDEWFVDLPTWEGSEDDLQMVQGADTLLEYLAEGKERVALRFSTKSFDGASVMERMYVCTTGGAYYIVHSYNGDKIVLPFWLCDVTKFVFGEFPENIYFTKVK